MLKKSLFFSFFHFFPKNAIKIGPVFVALYTAGLVTFSCAHIAS